MSISFKEDREKLEKLLISHKLDFSAVDIDALREMRKQHSVSYVTGKVQFDEEIILAQGLIADLDAIGDEDKKMAREFLEGGAKDDSLRPKSDAGKMAGNLMTAINAKHGEVLRSKLLCEFHLKLVKKYDDLVDECMKDGNAS